MLTNAQSCRVIMHPAAGTSPIAIQVMQQITGRVAARRAGSQSGIIYLLTPQEAEPYRRQGGAA